VKNLSETRNQSTKKNSFVTSECQLAAWQKILGFKKDEKITNPSKLRVDLRFYADLISVGVFSLKDSLPILGSVLTNLVAMDKEEHSNVAIILVIFYDTVTVLDH
jgi:hypothetical protein